GRGGSAAMRAREDPGRAPGASSEANSGAKFTAPSQALSPIDYDVDVRDAIRRSGVDFGITQLSAARIVEISIDRFFARGGAWEDLRNQLIDMGRAVVPAPPKGAKRTQ